MVRFQWPIAVLILAIIAVQCGSAAEDAGWDNGTPLEHPSPPYVRQSNE